MKQSKSISPNTVTAAFMPVSSLKQIKAPVSKDKNSWLQLPVQRKLSIGAVDDPLEAEADAMADKVMRMPEQSFIQRKCAHCGAEKKIREKPIGAFIQRRCAQCEKEEELNRKPLVPFIQRKSLTGTSTASDTVSAGIAATKGGGTPLLGDTKSFMESRFDTDFSTVKIHNDNEAAQLSAQLNAQAFTIGTDIYFNEGKYQPESGHGKRLLAHELTHVVQQSGASSTRIARFTDDAHHIIDEAGLTGGGFTKDQIKDIEEGNKLRDYSQLPAIGNAILLCNPGKFGGYGQTEHFDNYIWDKEKNEWRDRSLLANQKTGLVDAAVRGSDPIAHIKNKLGSFIRSGLVKQGLNDLGIAFHAVEDFFAHSNFIDLINNDFRFGKELVTGSVPGTASVSLLHTAEDVSTKESAAYYRAAGEAAKDKTDRLSHANIAKDHLGDRNHIQARKLAALVVQELSSDLLRVLQAPEADRMRLLESIVFSKIDRYLKYPDAERDPWWTKLTAADNGAIDRLLEKAQDETPATVNQCMFSPLRNLEASKDSNMKIILGAALPVKVFGATGFIQAGGGLMTPLSLDDAIISSDRADKPAWFVGGQLTIPLK